MIWRIPFLLKLQKGKKNDRSAEAINWRVNRVGRRGGDNPVGRRVHNRGGIRQTKRAFRDNETNRVTVKVTQDKGGDENKDKKGRPGGKVVRGERGQFTRGEVRSGEERGLIEKKTV